MKKDSFIIKENMKAKKKLGIWMDHSIAYLMEFTSNAFEI
jgi:hypothetical protein